MLALQISTHIHTSEKYEKVYILYQNANNSMVYSIPWRLSLPCGYLQGACDVMKFFWIPSLLKLRRLRQHNSDGSDREYWGCYAPKCTRSNFHAQLVLLVMSSWDFYNTFKCSKQDVWQKAYSNSHSRRIHLDWQRRPLIFFLRYTCHSSFLFLHLLLMYPLSTDTLGISPGFPRDDQCIYIPAKTV